MPCAIASASILLRRLLSAAIDSTRRMVDCIQKASLTSSYMTRCSMASDARPLISARRMRYSGSMTVIKKLSCFSYTAPTCMWTSWIP